MRARSLITTSAIIGGLFIYAPVAMVIAELLPPYWPVQAAFFTVAGLVWIVPASRCIKWSLRRPPPSG